MHKIVFAQFIKVMEVRAELIVSANMSETPILDIKNLIFVAQHLFTS